MTLLAVLKHRITQATPGPWKSFTVKHHTGRYDTGVGPSNTHWIVRLVPRPEVTVEQDRANAELIAHAPQDLARLIKACEVMAEGLARIRSGLTVQQEKVEFYTKDAAADALTAAAEILKGDE